MVLLILALTSMLALPKMGSALNRARLSGAAGEVVIALEYARLIAMTTGGRTRVTVDETADTILVERFKIPGDLLGGAAEIPQEEVENGGFVTMGHPVVRGSEYYIVFSGEDRFNAVDILSSAFGAGNFLTFDTLGVPSAGGTVTLSRGNRQVAVSVDSSTGKVTSGE